eukprot:scaffold1148_cov108-Isochrysis_galbana.AAC.9
MPGGVGILVPNPLTSPADMARLTLPSSPEEAARLVREKLPHVLQAVHDIRVELDGKASAGSNHPILQQAPAAAHPPACSECHRSHPFLPSLGARWEGVSAPPQQHTHTPKPASSAATAPHPDPASSAPLAWLHPAPHPEPAALPRPSRSACSCLLAACPALPFSRTPPTFSPSI